MRQRIWMILTLIVFFISGLAAQEDSFPPDLGDDPRCPPPAWCDFGPSSFMSNSDIDALGAALKDPPCDNPDCLLGYYFLQLIKPLYPDCYPNCNLEPVNPPSQPAPPEEPAPGGDTPPDEGGTDPEPDTDEEPTANSLIASTEASPQVFKYLSGQFVRDHRRGESSITQKGLNGGKVRITGTYAFNTSKYAKNNEFRAVSMDILNRKGQRFDTVWIVFDQKRIVFLNNSWLKENYQSKSQKRRRGKY